MIPRDKDQLIAKAGRIYSKVQERGPQQVRWYQGMLLTYQFPAPRGYGVHGILIGVYTQQVQREWIEDDLINFPMEIENAQT